jgi:hypothetical protein
MQYAVVRVLWHAPCAVPVSGVEPSGAVLAVLRLLSDLLEQLAVLLSVMSTADAVQLAAETGRIAAAAEAGIASAADQQGPATESGAGGDEPYAAGQAAGDGDQRNCPSQSVCRSRRGARIFREGRFGRGHGIRPLAAAVKVGVHPSCHSERAPAQRPTDDPRGQPLRLPVVRRTARPA